MSFQKTLNRDLPRGVAGDFASTNPRNSVLAAEGALVAAGPILVGQFAFVGLTTQDVHQIYSAGMIPAFIHRNNQAVVAIGQQASMVIPSGKEVTAFSTGDFYAICPAAVAPNDPVYALDATGALSSVATDAQPTNFVFAEAGTAGKLIKITRFSI